MAMKTIPQSLNLRSLILENFEEALLTSDLNKRNSLMNFVIVGAGPTGVELAGALAEIKKGISPKDYPDLDTRLAQINLIQSGDRILKEMSEKASKKAEDFLEDLCYICEGYVTVIFMYTISTVHNPDRRNYLFMSVGK